MLQIKNLSLSIEKKFFFQKKFINILNNISIDISINDSPLIIVGPSGSGKSTFLRCIGFLENHNGEISFNNKSITKKNINSYRKDFGFVFQEYGLFSNMTVIENICYTPINVYKYDKDDIKNRCMEMLKNFEIIKIANSYPKDISGGEKQKVAIIRCLILDPKIIFFDEPTSGLDKKSISSLETILSRLKNIILVIVTHDEEFGKKIGKKICNFQNSGELYKLIN